MAGSAGIAAAVAQAAFWALMLVGFASGEFNVRHGVIFGLLWLLGRIGLPFLPHGDMLFPSYVAILDVVLTLKIFKGDVTLH